MGSVPAPPESPLERAVARVGDRWSLLVISALLDGPRRFGELQEAVTAITPTVLSQRLKHLEREGVVVPRPYSTRPPRCTYQLSAAGHDLAGALRLLAHWGAGDGDAGAADHSVCGTSMELRWWCPTCQQAPAPAGGGGDGDSDVSYA